MSNIEPQERQPLKLAGIDIPISEQTPLVLSLAAVIQRLELEVRELRDEIQRMKGTTQRPKIKPSRLLKPPAVADGPPDQRSPPLR